MGELISLAKYAANKPFIYESSPAMDRCDALDENKTLRLELGDIVIDHMKEELLMPMRAIVGRARMAHCGLNFDTDIRWE